MRRHIRGIGERGRKADTWDIERVLRVVTVVGEIENDLNLWSDSRDGMYVNVEDDNTGKQSDCK